MIGMLIAVLTTLAGPGVSSYGLIIVAIIIGGIIGAFIARGIKTDCLAAVGGGLPQPGRSGGGVRRLVGVLEPRGLSYRHAGPHRDQLPD